MNCLFFQVTEISFDSRTDHPFYLVWTLNYSNLSVDSQPAEFQVAFASFHISLFSYRGRTCFNNSLNWNRWELEAAGVEAFQTFYFYVSSAAHFHCALQFNFRAPKLLTDLNELRKEKTTGVRGGEGGIITADLLCRPGKKFFNLRIKFL